MNPKAKRWIVLYSHCHGDVGFEDGLTFRQAQRKFSDLAAQPQFLDFVRLAYDATPLAAKADASRRRSFSRPRKSAARPSPARRR